MRMMPTTRNNFLRRYAGSHLLACVLIALTALLAYAWIIPRLGYSYDDWYMLWSGVSRGAGSLVPLFSMDRPFMGIVYSVFFRLFGTSIPAWHLAALFFRILGGLGFYWILCLVWPRLKSLAVLSAMLFVVFPGFLAEPNAATKINQLLGFSAAIFSIAFSLQAGREERPRWRLAWTGLSLLALAVYLWYYEYMIGLEALRLALLAWTRWERSGESPSLLARKLVRQYLPLAAVIALFLVWRIFLFDSARSATDVRGLAVTYYSNFADMLLRLFFQVIKDFFSAAFFAWFVQPFHLLAAAEYGQILLALLLALLVMALAAAYLWNLRAAAPAGQEPAGPRPRVLLLLGALTVLAAVAPVVFSNRYLNLMDPYKSYALHPSLGALLILLGLLFTLKPKFRQPLLVLLLGFSLGTQALNGLSWARYWEAQRSFFWQLTWRAPDIRDNTLVIGLLPDEFVFHEDYEIWGPLNLIYRPGRAAYPAIQAQILNPETLPQVLTRPFVETQDRDIYMPEYYTNTLILSQPSGAACLRAIDGSLPAYSAGERALIEKVGVFSSLDFIDPLARPATPPAAIFGPEPPHGWCYFYEQAALARQRGDWARIAALYQQAQSAGLRPADASEYFVFIEGLVNLDRAADARSLAEQHIKPSPALQYSLCQSLSAAPEYPASFGYRQTQIREVVCK